MSNKSSSKAGASPLTTIILPAMNEAEHIVEVVHTIGAVLDGCGAEWEAIVVDDGSKDDTYGVLVEEAAKDSRVRAFKLSRNFGKESAVLVGLTHARGDRVITMDADLQHPPEAIPEMIKCWENGAKVVNAVKRNRDNDSLTQRVRANVFNSIISALGGVSLHNSSDFKLIDRTVVDTIVHDLPERNRFYRGLTEWVGFDSETVEFDVEERIGGTESQWSIVNLIELALTALVSFTSAPLRIVTILGVATLALGFCIGLDAVISWFLGKAISGFATMIITLLVIGSFVMISLGIIGEYIAKIYEEVKQRPTYLIQASTDPDDGK